MRKICLICTVLLAVCSAGLQAESHGRRWFAEISGGTGSLGGCRELKDYYDLSFSLSADLGFTLNDYIALLPVSASYRNFSFDSGKYFKNYRSYRILLPRDDIFDDIVYSDRISPGIQKAASTLRILSLAPGVVFYSPEAGRLRLFGRIGAGVFYSRVRNIQTFMKEFITQETETDPGLSLQGGAEYKISEKASFTLRISYEHIFSSSSYAGADAAERGIPFYYIDPLAAPLKLVVRDKDLRLFELRAGARFKFRK